MSDTTSIDLAIIGAGPAGLSAAVTASELGLSTVVFDEGTAPGGQIYRAIEEAGGRTSDWLSLLGTDYAKGGDLVARFRACGADYRPGHAVFDIAPDGGLGVLGPQGAQWLTARRILVATGAMERPVPVPGWTLPGVMGAGAAQTLLKASGMIPSGRTAIVGSGPLVLLVARQLLAAGADIAAILDTTPRSNYAGAAPVPAGRPACRKRNMEGHRLAAPGEGRAGRLSRQCLRHPHRGQGDGPRRSPGPPPGARAASPANWCCCMKASFPMCNSPWPPAPNIISMPGRPAGGRAPMPAGAPASSPSSLPATVAASAGPKWPPLPARWQRWRQPSIWERSTTPASIAAAGHCLRACHASALCAASSTASTGRAPRCWRHPTTRRWCAAARG